MPHDENLAKIKLTTKIPHTSCKAKATGVATLAKTNNSIFIENMELQQVDCNSSIFIYRKLRLTDVCISQINRQTKKAHLNATIELYEPKTEETKTAETSSSFFSTMQSLIVANLSKVAPTSQIEYVNLDVPFEINEDESQVKVRFSKMGFNQKITATLL